jgi:hypothetical protein
MDCLSVSVLFVFVFVLLFFFWFSLSLQTPDRWDSSERAFSLSLDESLSLQLSVGLAHYLLCRFL